jgi:hypothetical protein
MKIASGRYCWAISATLAATVIVSAPVSLIHETLRASRPRRSTITLRSSPNRATSTPMTNGSENVTTASRVMAASTTSLAMNCIELARGNSPLTRTRTKSESSP